MKLFCPVLLGFLCIGHVACGHQEDSAGSSSYIVPDTGSGDVCYNIRCPSPQPMSCKDVKGLPIRKIAMMFDGLEVLCDTKTDNGGWTIIQKRTDGSVDFFRNWASYKYGFGSFTNEFWLGLEWLHQMTSKRCFELRIDMKYNGNDYYAKYSYIKVWGEKENYRLDLGTYSGNAGDSLTPHKNKPFSTKDIDNDESDDNCAVKHNGGWWYAGCARSNFNGLWLSKQYGKGLNWQTLTGYDESVSASEIKIRPCY